MRHATDITNVATFVISKNIYKREMGNFITKVMNLMAGSGVSEVGWSHPKVFAETFS